MNERDMLGDELVPDYLTSVKEGAFYGWPYAYFGPIEDPRKKGERPDLVAKTIPPDFSLGAHVAPLGLAFYSGASFPERYRNGAFVALHGSWNRSRFSGYKVVFVPFQQGRPSADAEDFLTGFIQDENASTVHGRPVGLALARGRLPARGGRWGELRVAGERGEVGRPSSWWQQAEEGDPRTAVDPAAERLDLRIACEPLESPLILLLANDGSREPRAPSLRRAAGIRSIAYRETIGP